MTWCSLHAHVNVPKAAVSEEERVRPMEALLQARPLRDMLTGKVSKLDTPVVISSPKQNCSSATACVQYIMSYDMNGQMERTAKGCVHSNGEVKVYFPISMHTALQVRVIQLHAKIN